MCSCNSYINHVKRREGEIQRHLLHYGILNTYTVWVEHGEVDPSK